jgi:hypothetical protein
VNRLKVAMMIRNLIGMVLFAERLRSDMPVLGATGAKQLA